MGNGLWKAVVHYATLLYEITAAVWACTRLVINNSQSGAKEGLTDPLPGSYWLPVDAGAGRVESLTLAV